MRRRAERWAPSAFVALTTARVGDERERPRGDPVVLADVPTRLRVLAAGHDRPERDRAEQQSASSIATTVAGERVAALGRRAYDRRGAEQRRRRVRESPAV